MSKTYQYRPQGVCSQLMEITVNDGILEDVQVLGGCSGNLQGIASLVRGMKVEDVIQRLDGIRCGRKATSCPDQLAQALKALPKESKHILQERETGAANCRTGLLRSFVDISRIYPDSNHENTKTEGKNAIGEGRGERKGQHKNWKRKAWSVKL